LIVGSKYLPLPTSQDQCLYCPSLDVSKTYAVYQGPAGSQRDFYHNWQWPPGTLPPSGRFGSGIVDINYIFRSTMDGIGGYGDSGGRNLNIGVQLDKIGKYTYVTDWGSRYLDFHKGVIHVLFGDTHVEPIGLGKGSRGLMILDKIATNPTRFGGDGWMFMYYDDYFGDPRWNFPKFKGTEYNPYPNIATERRLW
jgi:hypothetical protein